MPPATAIDAAMATSIGCVGRCTVPVTASASVVECAMVNAVMMVKISRATCERFVAPCHCPFTGRSTDGNSSNSTKAMWS